MVGSSGQDWCGVNDWDGMVDNGSGVDDLIKWKIISTKKLV